MRCGRRASTPRASTRSCCSPRRRAGPASASPPTPTAPSAAPRRGPSGDSSAAGSPANRSPTSSGAADSATSSCARTRRVLIPRPETELLVEVAVELAPTRVLDVGTGSGAVALAIADELPASSVVAVDTSADAVAAATENASALGLRERIDFRHGTVAVAAAAGPFDLVVANLPYVPTGERSSLAPEITRYEPDAALFAGADGLDVDPRAARGPCAGRSRPAGGRRRARDRRSVRPPPFAISSAERASVGSRRAGTSPGSNGS